MLLSDDAPEPSLDDYESTTTSHAPLLLPPPPPQLECIDCPEEEGVFLDQDELSEAQVRIKQWINLDSEITKLSSAIRERRKQKKKLDDEILRFMQKNKIPHFDLSRGKLSMALSQRKQALNHKWIMEKVTALDVFTDEHTAQINAALQDRPSKQVARLKHSAHK